MVTRGDQITAPTGLVALKAESSPKFALVLEVLVTKALYKLYDLAFCSVLFPLQDRMRACMASAMASPNVEGEVASWLQFITV